MSDYAPMKAVLTDQPFSDPNWIFERKLDGERCGGRSVAAGDGETAFREACRRGREGVIAKRADSPYAATRSRDWLKVKCSRGQELVIGGWTAPKGSRGRHPRYQGLRDDKPAREVVREEPSR